MRKACVRGLWIALVLLATGTAASAADEPFLVIFGGYSDNEAGTGAGSTVPYGIRGGTETPVAGGQLSLTFNRDGDVKMDTLMADILLHFGSTDARTRRNRILYNRLSGFAIVGLGAMRYDAATGRGASTIFAWEIGVGMQAKLTRDVGIRVQIESLYTGANNFNNVSANFGVAWYF